MGKRLKNSVGIWAFGPGSTRFLPDGYRSGLRNERMFEKVKRVVDGLEDWVDGFEFHYPNEINENNVDKIKNALGDKDIYAIPLGFHNMKEFINGSFVNPDDNLRSKAIYLAKRAVDLAASENSHLIIWPGGEGYNYPFEVNYSEIWNRFIEGIGEVVEYAGQKGVAVFSGTIKNSEPARRVLMRDIGMTLFTINKIEKMGIDVTNLKNKSGLAAPFNE